MTSRAQAALQRAAERSQRLAELSTARFVVERSLGYELAEDQFNWLHVMSMPYSVGLHVTNQMCIITAFVKMSSCIRIMRMHVHSRISKTTLPYKLTCWEPISWC